MWSIKVLTVVAVLIGICNADPVARLAGGQEVDSLRQFPHHVYITPFNSGRKCGGSILNAHWILTSAACVKDTIRLDIHFGKKNEFDNVAGYYSISVNSDQIYVYPTNYDDLALVRIPMRIVFSDIIAPVNISRLSLETLRNRFTVMPGFTEVFSGSPSPSPTTIRTTVTTTSTSKAAATVTPTTATMSVSTTPKTTVMVTTTTTKASTEKASTAPTTLMTDDNLRYGMFNVLDNSVCKQSLGSGHFDEYTQMCTQAWGTTQNMPCDSDFGSGLIIGWPAKNELVGVFSEYYTGCDNSKPAVFTYVAKYLPWIESMIQG